MTPQRLSAAQGRVLGALVEKERSTPQGYPLTDAALLAACNQTTSRDPVVQMDVQALRPAVRDLRERGLLRTVHRTGERSDKHRHELPGALALSVEQSALLAVLLLRGPQTAAELRARSERLLPFSGTEQVERVLDELAGRDEPLVALLERQPGRKEPRWAQLLAEPFEHEQQGLATADAMPAAEAGGHRDRDAWPDGPAADISGASTSARQPGAATAGGSPALVGGGPGDEHSLSSLRAEVAELRAEVTRLRLLVESPAGQDEHCGHGGQQHR